MSGGPYVLDIRVQLYQPSRNGSFEIAEKIDLEVASFMDVCAVLAQFHELAETLKKKRQEQLAGGSR